MHDDMEKELKLELLQKLMDEMDDNVARREQIGGKKEEPMVVVEEKETQAMPLSDLKDKAAEVMSGGEEKESEEPSEEEDEEDYGDSNLMRKLRELKRSRSDSSSEE